MNPCPVTTDTIRYYRQQEATVNYEDQIDSMVDYLLGDQQFIVNNACGDAPLDITGPAMIDIAANTPNSEAVGTFQQWLNDYARAYARDNFNQVLGWMEVA